MSYFEDASLVLIPSGIKDQKVYSIKPTDGSGDLTFSRASNATRVNSSGLVEKVRENLILQSNSFDTTWTSINTTETIGAADFDGGNNAWTLAKTASGGKVTQNLTSLPAKHCFSVYAKAGTLGQIALETSSVFSIFDLSTGVVVSGGGVIQSVGGGWYRCSVTDTPSSNGFTIYPAPTADASGNIIIYKAQVEAGDIATDYIATTSAAVSVGPVSGLPRLDYSGGASCPSLLLEPQRTNLALYSEQMDNAYYGKVNSSITANATTSPDGYTNADKLVDNTTNGYHAFETSGISTSIGAVYTVSLFAKKGEKSVLQILFDGGDVSGNPRANFDLQNGVLGSVDAAITATITDYGGGWYRCTATATSAVTSFIPIFCIVNSTTSSRVENYAGNGTDGLFVWGAQLEAGAYATSYIPTLSSAVTRVADAASKTGIASLIGQSEGTLFWDFNVLPSTLAGSYYLQVELNDGTASNSLAASYYADGRIQFAAFVGGSLVVNINLPSYGLTVGKHKFAFAYKLNDYVAYVDGVSVGTDTSASVGAMSKLDLYDTSGGTNDINQVLLFKTRLPNSDLATLTA